MIRSQLKSSLRSVLKQGYFSVINILGLTIGLAAFTLIALFVQHEFSYDQHNQGVDLTYRMVRDKHVCSPPPLATAIKARIPEVEYVSRIIPGNNLIVTVNENHFVEEEYFWADQELLDVFSFEFIYGNPSKALTGSTGIIISDRLAKKYFDDQNPMGQMVTVDHEHSYFVSGVFRDLPTSSHFSIDIALPMKQFFQIKGIREDNWGSNYAYTYLKLHANTDVELVNQKYVELEKEIVGWTPESEEYQQHFMLQPVADIHLFSHRQQELQANGNIKNVILFISIGILILAISIINYINLTTAMLGVRFKEVSVRKAIGTSKAQIVNQFLSESVVVALISMVAAMGIARYTMAPFGQLMEREILIETSDIQLWIPACFILAILVGLAAGFVPSRSIANTSITSLKKGSSGGRGTFRNVLVGFQFTIALVLIIFSINIERQLTFLFEKDLGYDKEQIITVKLFDKTFGKDIQAIKSELMTSANVGGVSSSYELPHAITGFRKPDWFCQNMPDCTPISYNSVDYNFVDLFGLEVVEGRNFSRDYPSDQTGAFLVNEKALKVAGWDSPIGKEISHYDGTKGKIVGVIKDFHFQSMHAEVAPIYLKLDASIYSHLAIKLNSGQVSAGLDETKEIINKYAPNTPLEYRFLDDEFEKVYHSEKRLGRIFTYFSILATLLGCLGLYGMSSFIISKRIKEIGVRKVLGATNSGISFLLGKSFLLPVVIANILAWPAAYYMLRIWLDGFAIRTTLTLWPFLLAMTIVLIITTLTVGVHTRRLASQNPLKSLRAE